MGKLIFRYGAMGSSKSANALMVRFNYQERGMQTVVLLPRIEKRDGCLRSRIGLEAKAEVAEEFLSSKDLSSRLKGIRAVIVDEVQFLEPCWIDKLARIVDGYNIPVICYGLKTDFQTHLFPGAKRLLELADLIEEIPTVCWCGKKAHMNARIDPKTKEIVKEGNSILQGNDYVALCRKHFVLEMPGERSSL